MNDARIQENLGWLSLALAAQRNTIGKILARLRGIGVRAGTSLGLHGKFMRFLEQVAAEQEKELGLLHEIETVERQHQDLRQRNLLCRPFSPGAASAAAESEENPPPRINPWLIFGLLYLFSQGSAKHKNQELTVD